MSENDRLFIITFIVVKIAVMVKGVLHECILQFECYT